MNQLLTKSLTSMNYTAPILFRFSNRFEFLQWWITIPYHLIIISSFIILLILSKYQPLKSKGVIPFLTCILFSNNLVRGYLANLPLSIIINVNLCYLEAFLNTPNNVSVIVLTVLNLNKLVVMQYFNKRKNQIYKKGDSLEMKWYIKLYKIMNHPLFYLVYFIILYILQCFLQVIALIIVKFQCTSQQFLLSYGFILASVMGIIIFAIVLLLCEILLNLEKIKKCELGKIWRSDPFYFRIEVYIFAIFICAPLYIAYAIITLVGSIDNAVDIPIFSLVFFVLYIYLVLIPIFTTIIKLISNLSHPKENKGELDRLLSSDDGLEILSKACEMEYSIENLSCWKDIQDYNKEKSFDEKKKKFERIKLLYLNGSDSELEINVGSEILLKIHEKLKLGNFDNDLLKELDFYVKRNLSDTFLRLSATDEYKLFKSHKELMVQTNVAE